MEEIERLADLQEKIEREQGLMLYFYNDDCPPCISLRPKVEVLVSESFPLMKLVWINSKRNPDIPAAYQIFANPVILVFFEGKEFKRFSKYISIDELKQSTGRIYDLVFSD
jgi:thioredoxin 1